jgi:LysM repeat protein
MKQRRILCVALFVAAAVLAATAWAQQSQQGQASPAPKAVGVAQKTEVTDYKVEPGDTLWGLAEKFYGDPWTWPQIWEMNPQVTDPHWLHPGQILKIRTEKGAVATFVPGRKPKAAAPQDLVEMVNLPAFDTTFSYTTRVNKIDLISEEALDGAGEIVNNIDNQIVLGQNHNVFFSMRKNANVQLGDVFTVFRIGREVENPVKRERAGYLINLLGEVQTVDASTLPNGKIVYSGRLIDSSTEIAVGDRVIPMSRDTVRIKLKLTDLEMTGSIIASNIDADLLIGYDNLAFIDLGLKQGVKIGNSFSVWRRSEDPENVPSSKIGNVIVLRVGDKTSTVLLANCTRPPLVGDTVMSDVQ